MSDFAVRSPAGVVGGLVYFGRMLDKIRVHARGELPPEYQANLGHGFDEFCCAFLQVEYEALVKRVKDGGSDQAILEWCFQSRRRPNELEIFAWNEFMRKRGWSDDVTETLVGVRERPA